MRVLTILLVLFFLAQNLGAQSLSFSEPVKTTTTKRTPLTLTVENKEFAAFKSTKGALYIERTSKSSGKTYRSYLGYITAHKYEGKTVYTNKDQTKYHYLLLGRTGFPKKMPLEVN